jgi:hypothetical protein
LVELKNQKCKLLKVSADIRVARKQNENVEMLNLEMRCNHLKTRYNTNGSGRAIVIPLAIEFRVNLMIHFGS